MKHLKVGDLVTLDPNCPDLYFQPGTSRETYWGNVGELLSIEEDDSLKIWWPHVDRVEEWSDDFVILFKNSKET